MGKITGTEESSIDLKVLTMFSVISVNCKILLILTDILFLTQVSFMLN